MLNTKIADHHLVRHACIYIRQSTPAQVRFNQESTERQYNLANQAKALGWTPEQIRILDGDLGQSGQLTTKRDDFKTLVSDVAMGQVGAIFSLESSRLAACRTRPGFSDAQTTPSRTEVTDLSEHSDSEKNGACPGGRFRRRPGQTFALCSTIWSRGSTRLGPSRGRAKGIGGSPSRT